MHHRYFSVVATIATSAMIACGDAAVDKITAPRPAVTPVTPVMNDWPSEDEFVANEIPGAIGIQISGYPRFEDNYRWFVVEARVRFQWANEVSAKVNASLINKSGATINQGSAGMSYKRLALPVASGDTTLTVKISTNNILCGLIGKSSYEGQAAQRALNLNLIQILLWDQTITVTNLPDVLEPVCDAPEPPSEGGGEEVEVCYTVWREVWVWNWAYRTFYLYAEIPLGTFCYVENQMT
jgi:hypothetical protein